MILIFYFFLFKNGDVFSPEGLTKLFTTHLFTQWAEHFNFWYSNYKSSNTELQVHGYLSGNFPGTQFIIPTAFLGYCWPQRSITLNDFGCVLQEAIKKTILRGEMSQHSSDSCFAERKRSLKLWDILNISQPQVVKSMRSVVRDTHEFRRKKTNVFATPFYHQYCF